MPWAAINRADARISSLAASRALPDATPPFLPFVACRAKNRVCASASLRYVHRLTLLAMW